MTTKAAIITISAILLVWTLSLISLLTSTEVPTVMPIVYTVFR